MSDVESELEAIEAVLAASPDTYFKDQAMQARYSELVREEAGEAADESYDPGAGNIRIAEIERMMAEPGNSSEYWHSPRLQDEYRALLEAREATAAPAGPDLADALGLSDEAAQEVNDRVGRAFQHLDTNDLDTAWLGLSEEAQLAFGRVLADPGAILASAESVENFRQQIGEPVFEEVLAFERGMSDAERTALKRACRVA